MERNAEQLHTHSPVILQIMQAFTLSKRQTSKFKANMAICVIHTSISYKYKENYHNFV